MRNAAVVGDKRMSVVLEKKKKKREIRVLDGAEGTINTYGNLCYLT